MKTLIAVLLLSLCPSFNVQEPVDFQKEKFLQRMEEITEDSVAGIYHAPGQKVFQVSGPLDSWEDMSYATRNESYFWEIETMDACASIEDCTAATEEMCRNAGHGGVDADTVEINQHANDSGSTCSGDCQQNDAVAFVMCN